MAQVEIRLGIGSVSANPKQLLDYSRSQSATPPKEGVTRVMVNLTGVYYFKSGFGLGFRGEVPSISDGEKDTMLTTIMISRSAPLLGYRFQGKDFYFGLLGTYGVFNQGTVTWNKAGVETKGTIRDISSSSGALEIGVIRNSWVLGFEAGYLQAVGKKVSDKDGATIFLNGEQVKADLSGIYGVAVIGYQFH